LVSQLSPTLRTRILLVLPKLWICSCPYTLNIIIGIISTLPMHNPQTKNLGWPDSVPPRLISWLGKMIDNSLFIIWNLYQSKKYAVSLTTFVACLNARIGRTNRHGHSRWLGVIAAITSGHRFNGRSFAFS
jgi:hypothetical protein